MKHFIQIKIIDSTSKLLLLPSRFPPPTILSKSGTMRIFHSLSLPPVVSSAGHSVTQGCGVRQWMFQVYSPCPGSLHIIKSRPNFLSLLAPSPICSVDFMGSNPWDPLCAQGSLCALLSNWIVSYITFSGVPHLARLVFWLFNLLQSQFSSS